MWLTETLWSIYCSFDQSVGKEEIVGFQSLTTDIGKASLQISPIILEMTLHGVSLDH